jgi:hypothetical protein
VDAKAAALYGISPAFQSARAPERLPFVLHDFTRHSWAGERARFQWEPRLARIANAWLDIEWMSTAEGIRDCALLWLSSDVLGTLIPKWEASGVSAIPLETEGNHFGGAPAELPGIVSGMVCVAVGGLERLGRLRQAWTAADHDAAGRFFGYPSCCREFFRDVWIRQGCIDTTWAMAKRTPARAATNSLIIELPAEVPPLANMLWRWLGVRAVPHLPCRFDCSASIEFATELLELGRRNGYAEEMDWILEILSWPVEWSALHGIAEVKSPVVKVITRTDATADKWVVRWVGTSSPEEGAVGLHFPYHAPQKPMFTKSPAYERGLVNGACGHAEDQGIEASWRFADNGFASAEAMDLLHRPIVALAREGLSAGGTVLDLGCGNGTLLAKICQDRPDLVPFGVDTNVVALGHARALLPRFAKNFKQADIFDTDAWHPETSRYQLGILMPGRLLEVSEGKAAGLLDRLRSCCSRVLVYVYPDWSDESLDVIVRRLGLELEECGQGTASYLKW